VFVSHMPVRIKARVSFQGPESYSEKTLARRLPIFAEWMRTWAALRFFSLQAVCSNGNKAGRTSFFSRTVRWQRAAGFRSDRENRSHTRVFPVGIGSGCNEHFIKGLAGPERASEFIHPGERIEPKVLSLFGKLGQAGLENASITWGALQVEQAPIAPAVFLGSPVTLFARSRQRISLEGSCGEGERQRL